MFQVVLRKRLLLQKLLQQKVEKLVKVQLKELIMLLQKELLLNENLLLKVLRDELLKV
jgi:siderophore synthetase component